MPLRDPEKVTGKGLGPGLRRASWLRAEGTMRGAGGSVRIKAPRTFAGSVAAESRRPVPGAAHLGGAAASESLRGSHLTGVGHGVCYGGRLPLDPGERVPGARQPGRAPRPARDARRVLPSMRESPRPRRPPLGTGDTERSHLRPAGELAARRWPILQVIGQDTEPTSRGDSPKASACRWMCSRAPGVGAEWELGGQQGH